MLARFFESLKHPITIRICILLVVVIQLGQYEFLYSRASRITPPGHVHAIENVDAYYPDVIRQSKMGAWAHTYSLTTEPTPPIYTYLFFIAAGKIAALFDIDPIVMYEITRVTGGIAVLLTTYWLISIWLPLSLQLPAIFFTLVLETGPVWTTMISKAPWEWIAALPPQAVIPRHFGLPHHTWSEAVGLSLLVVLSIAMKKKAWYIPLSILILSISGPLINPTYFLILMSCLYPMWVLYSYWQNTLHVSLPPILSSIVGIVCAGLFTKSQFLVGTPWNAVIAGEKTWWTTDFILIPFIQSFMLYYPFVIFLFVLIPFTWKHWSLNMRKLFFLTLGWSVLPIGLIYLSALPWVPLVNGRIASDLTPVPIALLCTLAIYAVGRIQAGKRIFQSLLLFMFALTLLLSSILTVRYHMLTIVDQNASISDKGNSFTLYPTHDLWEGMMELKKIPPWSHVMIMPRVGDILMAFMPIHVYQGNPHDGDVDWLERRGVSHRFYTGQLSRTEMADIFTKNNISYVFVGPEEKYAWKPQFYPEIFTSIFENDAVTIYRVNWLSLNP